MVNAFSLGLIIGIVLTLSGWALRREYLRRRIRKAFTDPTATKRTAGKPGAVTSIINKGVSANNPGRRKSDREESVTEVKRALDERETRMTEMLLEMRKLILHLTDVVAKTDCASGEVAQGFQEAREALDRLDLDTDIDLSRVRVVILQEIDKMVESNASLKVELENAHNGMTAQRREIDNLRTRAHIDGLTQLPNRTSFDEHVAEAVQGVTDMAGIFSLLMLDVDHFKQINDTHGHLNGDRLLREIADQIRENIRDDDFPARYGGEEFAVILPDTLSEEAWIQGERIRQAVEKAFFQVDGKRLRITISGGISQCGTGWSVEEVIGVADRALYRSKEKGRNRITLGGDRYKEPWTAGDGRI